MSMNMENGSGHELVTSDQPAPGVPRPRRILRVDPWACSWALLGVVFSAVSLIILLDTTLVAFMLTDSRRGGVEMFAILLGTVFLGLLPASIACVVRVREIQRLFARGKRYRGVLTRIVEHQGQRVAAEYRFIHDGAPRRGEVRVPNPFLLKPSPLRGFVERSEVSIVVDPCDPERTLLADLYAEGA